MTDILHAPAVMTETYDQVRRTYGAAIGRPRAELVTPVLVLDLRGG